MSAFANILAGGMFHAAVLFLVAAGLQLVFGVQKIVNLACGSFYALGAYFGITFIGYAHQFGVSAWLLLPGLIVAGLLLGFVGPPIERLLRTVYDRDESFQLLLTFALVLMFQDVFRFVWGANPRSLDNGYLIYGTIRAGDFSVPVYNLLVIAAAIAVAAGLGVFLQRTNYGRILRATAENRAMAEALGVNVLPHLRGRVHARHSARHHRRRAGGADRRGLARHGGRIRDRGLCGGRDRRARLDARRAGRRADRRPDPRAFDRCSIPSSRCWRSI